MGDFIGLIVPAVGLEVRDFIDYLWVIWLDSLWQ